MQCAASQSRVDWRFPRYNDIHFMNKLIIISSYTFQNAQVRDTRPRTVCSSLASPHSVRVWYVLYVALLTKRDSHTQLKSAFMRQLYKLPLCCGTMTLSDLTSPLHFLKLELGSKSCMCESSKRNLWVKVENIIVAIACT